MVGKRNFTLEEASAVAQQLAIDFEKVKFSLKSFCAGMNVELEHGLTDIFTNVSNDDPITTGKITLAHLNEFPDYYERLAKMEKEAEAFWEAQG
ncbi:MAG: DUF5661 family protein [Patescibacteria group bacterium]